MDIAEKKVGNINVLSLAGRLDAFNAIELEKKLNALIEAGQYNYVIDLAKLEYISSSGLRVFLASLKRVKKERGDIKLAGMQSFITEVFNISGFSQLFSIFESQEAAVNAFNQA